MKTLLVTGGAGSLGSNLIDHWSSRFHKIIVLDNFATSAATSLPPVANLKILEGDVSDESTFLRIFQEYQPDVVVHAAASYKNPDAWDVDANTNVLGSIYLAKLIRIYKPKLVVNLQTALVYGKPKTLPIPVDHPTEPVSSYAITKLAGESLLMNCGYPVISLRLANVTGPRLSIGPIPTFYKKLSCGEACDVSTAKRDFLDMADFLDLMDLILESEVKSGVFNVSTGRSNSILDIFNAAKNHFGSLDAEPNKIFEPGPDDIKEVVLDPSSTNITFGWKPKFQFEDIMSRAFKWYDNFGITTIYSHIRNREN